MRSQGKFCARGLFIPIPDGQLVGDRPRQTGRSAFVNAARRAVWGIAVGDPT